MRQWIVLLAVLWSVAGCDILSPPAASVPSEPVVQTDSQALRRWFDVSALPPTQQVQWIQQVLGMPSSVPGPTDYYILAVLEYDQPTAPFAEQLSLASHPDVVVSADFLRSWMPAAVVDSFAETADGNRRFTGTAYAAGELLMSPLAAGYILLVENYMVIYGFTM